MPSALDEEIIQATEVEAALPAARGPLVGRAIANMALRGLSMAGRFLLLLGLAHYLSPNDVGVFSLMYASTTLGTLFLGARFDVYSTRAICSGERSSPAAIIRDQIVFHLLVYAVVLPAMLLLFALGVLPWPLAGWFYLLLILEHSGQECFRLFVALGQPLRANFVFFVRSGLWAVALIVLMFAAPGFRSLEALWVLWSVGGVVSLLFAGAWMRSLGWRSAIHERVDWDWIRRGLRPSAAFTLAVGAGTIVNTVDRYFIELNRAHEHVGVYAFYSNLTNFVPTFAETGIVSILLPALLASAVAGDMESYRATMRKLTRGVWVVVAATVVLSLVIAPLVLMLVKKDPIYRQFFPAFGLLLASSAIATIAFIPHNALYARHRDRDIAIWSIASLAVALVCYAALTPQLGIYGVCAGSIASSLTLWLGKGWACRSSSGSISPSATD